MKSIFSEQSLYSFIISHWRSANLEQLYHEAIPMDKALSHSGPAMFGNGPLRQVSFSKKKPNFGSFADDAPESTN